MGKLPQQWLGEDVAERRIELHQFSGLFIPMIATAAPVWLVLLGICFWRKGLEAAFGPERRTARNLLLAGVP